MSIDHNDEDNKFINDREVFCFMYVLFWYDQF
jgi:hypothetical protein